MKKIDFNKKEIDFLISILKKENCDISSDLIKKLDSKKIEIESRNLQIKINAEKYGSCLM